MFVYSATQTGRCDESSNGRANVPRTHLAFTASLPRSQYEATAPSQACHLSFAQGSHVPLHLCTCRVRSNMPPTKAKATTITTPKQHKVRRSNFSATLHNALRMLVPATSRSRNSCSLSLHACEGGTSGDCGKVRHVVTTTRCFHR